MQVCTWGVSGDGGDVLRFGAGEGERERERAGDQERRASGAGVGVCLACPQVFSCWCRLVEACVNPASVVCLHDLGTKSEGVCVRWQAVGATYARC